MSLSKLIFKLLFVVLAFQQVSAGWLEGIHYNTNFITHHDGNVTYWSGNTIYSQGDIALVSVQSEQNNTEIIPYIYLKTGPSNDVAVAFITEPNSFVLIEFNLLEYVPSKIPSDLENGWVQDVIENVQIYFNKTYAPNEFDDGVQSFIEKRHENGLFLSTDDPSEVLNFLIEDEGNASSSSGYQEGVNYALEEINNNLTDYGFRDADSLQNEIIDLLSTQQRDIKSFTQGWFLLPSWAGYFALKNPIRIYMMLLLKAGYSMEVLLLRVVCFTLI